MTKASSEASPSETISPSNLHVRELPHRWTKKSKGGYVERFRCHQGRRELFSFEGTFLIAVGSTSSNRNAPSSNHEPVMVARPTSTFISDDNSVSCLAFPEWFPYGTGVPNAQRHRHIPFQEFVSYCLQLSTRAFQGYEFALQCYDRVARAKASQTAFVYSRIEASAISNINANLNSAEVEKLQEWTHMCAEHRLLDAVIPPPPQSPVLTQQFFTAIKACVGNMEQVNSKYQQALPSPHHAWPSWPYSHLEYLQWGHEVTSS